jgi:hypothetical protein
MSVLSNFLKRAAPVVAQYSPEPVSRTAAIALTAQYANQEANYQKKLAEERKQREEKRMAEIFGSGQTQGIQPPVNVGSTAGSGQGGFFSGLGNFFRGAGEAATSFFQSGLPNLFLQNRPRGVGQQPAITTTTNVGAQESQGSGSIDASMGFGLPSIIGAARGLIKSPVGQTGLVGGTAGLISVFGESPAGTRITRKQKAQAKALLNMMGGNLSATADILRISEQTLVMILLKRFRNDGPVVTKAALRKTKSTVRKLKNMCDMYDDLRPAARRRTPMRRARSSSTTLIKN